jgi:hypothetical protein
VQAGTGIRLRSYECLEPLAPIASPPFSMIRLSDHLSHHQKSQIRGASPQSLCETPYVIAEPALSDLDYARYLASTRVLPSQLRLATLRGIGIVRHFVECLLVPHGPEALVAGGA